MILVLSIQTIIVTGGGISKNSLPNSQDSKTLENYSSNPVNPLKLLPKISNEREEDQPKNKYTNHGPVTTISNRFTTSRISLAQH